MRGVYACARGKVKRVWAKCARAGNGVGKMCARVWTMFARVWSRWVTEESRNECKGVSKVLNV